MKRTEISDNLRTAARQGDSPKFTIQMKDEFDNVTHTIEIFSKDEALALSWQLKQWATEGEG